jgi:hypothetical protein
MGRAALSNLIRTGGGRYDPTDKPLYFISSNTDRLRQAGPMHDSILVAVNELRGEKDRQIVQGFFAGGAKILLDSGIFNLGMQHGRAHDLGFYEVLQLAPEQIDGFGKLEDAYTQLVTAYADQLWGYVELDQGGMHNKIRMRAKFEAKGLRPIPVYHPLVDDPSYFDYLGQRYDRICIANVVQSPIEVRRRILATVWEKKRRYPELWVHVLGYTPDPLLSAYPFESADSSTFLAAMRWGLALDRAFGKPLDLRRGFVPGLLSEGVSQDHPRGNNKATRLAGMLSDAQERIWSHSLHRLDELGAPYNPPLQEE